MKVNAATDPFDLHYIFDRPSSCSAGAGFLIYGACPAQSQRLDRRRLIYSFLDPPPPSMLSVTYPDYISRKQESLDTLNFSNLRICSSSRFVIFQVND